MVSLKDIARRCGVSTATVSKALNGQPDVGEETRQRIQALADEMGYTTNAAAKALKTNRTNNLGILFFDDRQSGLTHEYFSAVLESIRHEAEIHGYDITFINNSIEGRPTSYLRHCRYRGVDGAVIACVDFSDPRVLELVDSDLPLVTIDHVFDGQTAVMSDNRKGAYSLVQYAYAKGHRKIAFLHGERTSVTIRRLSGFYRACQELGISVPEEYVIGCAYHDTDRCYEATKKLLALPDRPTCILMPDDFSYLGGMKAIMEAGLSVPEDISVMGYDGIRLASIMQLTTFAQNTTELGREAVVRLIDLIERPKYSIREPVWVTGTLVEGSSVAQL